VLESSDLSNYIKKLREQKMSVRASIECYHTETRTSGSGKNRKTKTVTVVTHRASNDFNYDSCVDMSPRSVKDGGFNVIRLDSETSYIWQNGETRAAFDSMHQALVNANRHRDRSIRSSTHFTLTGVVDRQLLKIDPGDQNLAVSRMLKYMKARYLFLASLLGMGVLYQIWFIKHCGLCTLNFKKQIGLGVTLVRQPDAETEVVGVAVTMPIAFAEAYYASAPPYDPMVGGGGGEMTYGPDGLPIYSAGYALPVMEQPVGAELI
jgi:hypothetical protein